MQKTGIITGAFFMLTAVMLGAFAAHGLKEIISTEYLAIFKTGVFYQFIHALSILLVLLLAEIFKIDQLKRSIRFFVLGIIFFSGSLYLLAINSFIGISTAILGPATPIGGLFFIIGWSLIIFYTLKSKKVK